MSAIDPRATIEAFTKNVKSVNKVGSEDIDGTPTTHYVLVADTQALGDKLGKEARPPEVVTYDMWLDEEGRPRRIQADLGDQGSMQTDMTDYGSEVSIEAPPADQVQAMPGSSGRAEAQRPRRLPRLPFMLVGTGPLGSGMLERFASSALIR